jgi:hypothetical protein
VLDLSRRKNPEIFFEKSVAEAAKVVDMARSLCEKSSPLPLLVSVALYFGHDRPQR